MMFGTLLRDRPRWQLSDLLDSIPGRRLGQSLDPSAAGPFAGLSVADASTPPQPVQPAQRGFFGGSAPNSLLSGDASRGLLGDPNSVPQQQASAGPLVSTPSGAPPANSPNPLPFTPADTPNPNEMSRQSFWEGGRKFRLSDAAAGALAAIGDAFARQSGGQGNAVSMLAKERFGGLDAAEKAAAAKAMANRVAALPGMNPREFAAYLANPDQWGAHMADAASSNYSAANVGQSESRVYGNPSLGGNVYQPPRLVENGSDQLRYDPASGQVSTAVQGMTPGEQYARSLGLTPGSTEWNSAVRDAELKSNGPTAFGYDSQLEGQRQQGRANLAGLRHGYQADLRSQPTYGETHPRPQAGGIPTVRTPEEALKLPSGTTFRTPDGKIKVRP